MDPKDENLGCLCFEACNKPSHFFIYFAQIMLGIYYNKFRAIENSTLDHNFDTIQYENLSDDKHLMEFHFKEILEIGTWQAAHLFYCLYLNVKAEIFAEMFENLKPEISNKSDFFKAINQYYLDSIRS